MEFPMIVTGSPVWVGNVSVLPIFSTPPPTTPDYRLAHEAIEERRVRFPPPLDPFGRQLRVLNDGNEPVLFLQGDRIPEHALAVSTSVLIPPRSRFELQVRYSSHLRLSEGGERLSSAHAKQLRQQGQFWRWLQAQRKTPHEIDNVLAQEALQKPTKAVVYPKGACGIALGVGGQLNSIDLFDRAPVCERIWYTRIGQALELSAQRPPGDSLRAQRVHAALEAAQRLPWYWSDNGGIGSLSQLSPPEPKPPHPDAFDETSAVLDLSALKRLNAAVDSAPSPLRPPLPRGSALQLGDRLLHLRLDYRREERV